MTRIRQIWSRLGLAQRAVAIGIPLVLCAALGGAAALVLRPDLGPGPVAVVSPSPTVPTGSPPALPPDPTLDPNASPMPSPTPEPPGADPLLGTDGRLTVLLLGSDYRPAHPGNRTDAIMVVSVDPVTGEAAGFSVPRDTVGFPLGNGSSYGDKLNALYEHLQSTTGKGGSAMEAVFSKAFGIEIDGYVFIGFAGVQELVGAVGGVDVTLDKAYYDAEYWVTSSKQGWGLPAGRSHLGPKDALIFARSRKGDNDFGRARRQQILVLAALDKARRLGVGALPKLLQIASQTVRTDLPLDRARDLFHIVATTDISKVDRTVFGPTVFATGAAGTSFELKIDVCRAWIKDHFPAIRPMGQWPPASAVPSGPAPGSLTPSPTP